MSNVVEKRSQHQTIFSQPVQFSLKGTINHKLNLNYPINPCSLHKSPYFSCSRSSIFIVLLPRIILMKLLTCLVQAVLHFAHQPLYSLHDKILGLPNAIPYLEFKGHFLNTCKTSYRSFNVLECIKPSLYIHI